MTAWLEAARRSALETFQRVGLPTTDDEAWHYTSLAPLRERLRKVSAAGVSAVDPLAIDGALLAFVDGHFAADRSRHAPGVASLASLLQTEPRAVEKDLAGLAMTLEDGLGALNAALFTDGARVHVPRKTALERPIQLLFTASEGATVHVRSRLMIDADSSADVLELHRGAPGSVVESITEIVLGPGAELRYTRVVEGGAANVGRAVVRHHEHSRYFGTSLLLGGELARAETHVHLADGASCALSGASLVDGDRVADQTTVLHHGSNRGTSTQLFKAIVADHGTSTYYGKVKVGSNTSANDAKQSSKNLLLSPRATANTRPELEIDSQDVQCSHGATVGRLDEAHVFYLRSRGISEADARTMLIAAFAEEILERVSSDAIRAQLAPIVSARIAELTRSRS